MQGNIVAYQPSVPIVSSAQTYNVLIPDGVKPGQQFQTSLGGNIVPVVCPAHLSGGMTMQVTHPAQQASAIPVAAAIPFSPPVVSAYPAALPAQPPVKVNVNNYDDAVESSGISANGFVNAGEDVNGSPGFKAILVGIIYVLAVGGQYYINATLPFRQYLSSRVISPWLDQALFGNLYIATKVDGAEQVIWWVMAAILLASCFIIVSEIMTPRSGGKYILYAVAWVSHGSISPAACYSMIQGMRHVSDGNRVTWTYFFMGIAAAVCVLIASNKAQKAAERGGEKWSKERIQGLTSAIGAYFICLALVCVGNQVAIGADWVLYTVAIPLILLVSGIAGIASSSKSAGLPLLFAGFLLTEATSSLRNEFYGVGITHLVAVALVAVGMVSKQAKWHVVAFEAYVAAVCFAAFKAKGVAYVGGIVGFIGAIISLLVIFSDTHDSLKAFGAGKNETKKLLAVSGFLFGMLQGAAAFTLYQAWSIGHPGWNIKLSGFFSLATCFLSTILAVKGFTELRN